MYAAIAAAGIATLSCGNPQGAGTAAVNFKTAVIGTSDIELSNKDSCPLFGKYFLSNSSSISF